MAVNIEGVKGYEYQYKATLLIALMNMDIFSSELYIEIPGSEDALLKYQIGEDIQTLEVQVKREKNSLTVEKLIDWLTHFSSREWDNNLLSRISYDKCRLALFITRSRSTDDVAPLNVGFGEIRRHSKNLLIKDFTGTLARRPVTRSSLSRKRGEFCKKQAEELSSHPGLDSVLQRVLIWEEISDDKLDSEIIQMLNIKNRIALTRTRDVYNELLEIVKTGRDTSVNILPLIESVLRENEIGRPQIEKGYRERIEEETLNLALQNEAVLLLSGISLCGKSSIAKKLASKLFESGYDYKLSSDIEEIERFFSSNISDPKVAILEDPFGHSELVEQRYEKLRRVENLIQNSQHHHKLIITSRLEILLELNNCDVLAGCNISSHGWIDLTIRDSDVINPFWLDFATANSIPQDVVELISENINGDGSASLLQIGQLHYLANQGTENLINKTFSELDFVARLNSKDLALSIKEKKDYYAEIMFVLSLCCNTYQKISFTDLAYILSDDKARASVISKESFTWSPSDPEPEFPSYNKGYSLSLEAAQAIEYLEDRRLIHIIDENICFSHPDYLQAGRQVFILMRNLRKNRYLKYLEKAISCINPKNALISAKSLEFLMQNGEVTHKDKIVDIAILGLDSIFPAVEDSSLIFLYKHIHEIRNEKAQKIIYLIQNGGTDSSMIFWYKREISFISRSGSNFGAKFSEFDNEIVENIKNLLANEKLPSEFQTWFYLNSVRFGKVHPSYREFQVLLQHDAAFIRKEVAYSSLINVDNPNKELLTQIFNDDHPSVIFSGILAILTNWYRYNKTNKEYLFELLKTAITKDIVSIRAFNLLSTFSIDYSHEGIYNWRELDDTQTKDLWMLWGKLYPLAIRNVPNDIMLNTARFSASMGTAMQNLDISVGIPVLESWYKRIDNQIRKGYILDESELSISLNLMRLTKSDYVSRRGLFNQLLNYDDTSFLLSNLKWIISYWDDLHVSEKELIIQLIDSRRKDARWIKAVLLNTYSPPPKEITLSILGIEDLNEADIRETIDKFPEQLLNDCLHVYCGFPQPLWWLAVHHHNRHFWDQVIKIILESEDSVGFHICLQEFLGNGVNGFGPGWEDWQAIWNTLCMKVKNKAVLANSLIYNTARCSCNIPTATTLWVTLIDSYVTAKKEDELIGIVVDNIEVIQQTGHKEDLLTFFNSKFLEKIIKNLDLDDKLIRLLQLCEDSSLSEEDIERISLPILEIIRISRVRFFWTFIYIEYVSKKGKIPNSVKTHLDSIPNLIDQIGKSKLKEFEKVEEYKLDDWVVMSE